MTKATPFCLLTIEKLIQFNLDNLAVQGIFWPDNINSRRASIGGYSNFSQANKVTRNERINRHSLETQLSLG